MTVNERLYVVGLTNEFESCLKQKDFEKIKSILKKVKLNGDSIIEITNSLAFRNN
ncbi:hypothetical protein [Flavobacterium sp. DSP2-3-1]|uniref:hypothetical protein n=1 Tax=Flavobacterium sp. DSP2-3-1 TaxID=2804620 RepID=UPI003CE79AC7